MKMPMPKDNVFDDIEYISLTIAPVDLLTAANVSLIAEALSPQISTKLPFLTAPLERIVLTVRSDAVSFFSSDSG